MISGNVVSFVVEIAKVTEAHRRDGILAAIDANQAMIEFEPDGTIQMANENFLQATGYALSEIQGRHHKLFVLPEDKDSPQYAGFWKALASGQSHSGLFRRQTKQGSNIWLQASYIPITDEAGHVFKVVKTAYDVTASQDRASEQEAILRAVDKTQAAITFDLQGNILECNDNFCSAIGYRREEILGQHHRLFCTEEYAASADYRSFWEGLACGKFDAGKYKRIGKGGKEVWIQASYNPIFDASGNPI